jgi:hypothetical protein
MATGTEGNHIDASPARIVSVCGWCRRTLLPSGEWVENGTAVRELGYVDRGHVPVVSHGICPRCLDRLTDAMDR